MTQRLQMLLSKVNPHAGHIMVVGRGDAKTLILGTSNAAGRLGAINGASPLEHEVTALETERFREIESDLIARYRQYADDGLGHWVAADYEDVVAALNEYDLATGARLVSGNLRVGDSAYVKGIGAGKIEAFCAPVSFPGGKTAERVYVLSRRFGHVVSVPRSLVKPLLRAPL